MNTSSSTVTDDYMDYVQTLQDLNLVGDKAPYPPEVAFKPNQAASLP